MTSLTPTPYTWLDDHEIPQRNFLCGPAYQMGQVSLTVGPGGLGKSTLCITEAVSMAGGFSLFGHQPMNLRVWYLSAEDDKEEMDRRIAAACAAHHAWRSKNLHVDCVDRQQIQIAGPDGLNDAVIEDLINAIKGKIDVVIVDPFICTHAVSENDNSKIDKVARAWKRIAREGECAVHLVHHQAKDTREGSDGARGASALRDAARYIRTLVPVYDAEVIERLDLRPGGKHVRIVETKSNFHRTEGSHVVTLGTRTLLNGPQANGPRMIGDHVGVIELYPKHDLVPVQPKSGRIRRTAVAVPVRPARTDPAAEDEVGIILDLAAELTWKTAVNDELWLGRVVAEALNLDPKLDQLWLVKTFEALVSQKLLEEFDLGPTGKRGARVKFYRPAGRSESESS
ncbi:AAA family ATPase [Bosea sp. 124]|uniref:AAA family ATPase n=1 Tax=Bosea sp. 124 TaxID=2135642 RepID=UPI000D3D6CF5|nr:AAA family ATPase [Bosea sp. 124]PTM40607.1 AAA domain-containing protein [Bosea sp. 124]